MTAQTTSTTRPHPLLRRWPVLAGLAFTALVAFDMAAGMDLAPVLAASAVVYLGTAALRKPVAAWPIFFATVVIITVGKFAGFDPTWVVLGAGVLLLGYGLVRGALRPASGLPLQTLGLLGFGAAAAIALYVNPVFGGYLVAVGLLGHAAWDLYHHRTNKVVVRSLAEFCLVLDTALAVTIIVVTATA
ncbi:MAG: hypothetical protein GEV10_17220 [Streptosporangiales bacterium]|nr:hypothetical protein [Streptosporangiales bacterium]